MMSLKLRRNLPLVVLLLAILAFLALVWGNQPIIAYTAATDSRQGEALETLDRDVMNEPGGTASLLETLGADAGAPEQAMIQGE
jgi:hypothetical protein